MSLIGSTKLKILKHLQTGPAHGYEIANDIGISTGGIYTHLDDLREEGMVTVVNQESEGRQQKHYDLTENGKLLLEALEEDESREE